jgi:hypothetical protein
MARHKDLTGQKFGKLTALRINGQRKDRCLLWLCKCDCGKERTVPGKCLWDGHTKSCGCIKLLDLVGQRFGRLVVLERLANRRNSSVDWKCLCDCGKVHTAITKYLRAGHVRSCGCLQLETVSTQGGGHRQPEYGAFAGARARCQNPKDKDYAEYGGRGIEFRFKDFSEFFAAIGPRPSRHYTNDRIDNDGHYEAGNVMWATYQQQANNRRNSCEALKKKIAKLEAENRELKEQLKIALDSESPVCV